MIDITNGIETLTNFKRDTSRLLRQLKKTGEPVILTINGKAALVVQDAASYQELLKLRERQQTVQTIRQSLAAYDRGEGLPALEALGKLRRKLKGDRKS